MNLIDDNEALCRILLKITTQIKTESVRVQESNISRIETQTGGVIYGFTIHMEPPEHIPTVIHHNRGLTKEPPERGRPETLEESLEKENSPRSLYGWDGGSGQPYGN